MNMRNSEQHTAPKNGRSYRALAVARISTVHQDETSLDDQHALYAGWFDNEVAGNVEIDEIATQGSGEVLERDELIEIEDKVASGEYDFIIAEDLGRICRRVQAMIICEAAVDSQTRLIAINDHVDTANANWRQNALLATFRHEAYNEDTAHRIAQRLRNRFLDGKIVTFLPAGYDKPHSKANDADCSKIASAEPVYDEWFTRLEEGQAFADVALWLNEVGFPTSTHAKKEQWDGTLVGQTTRNPILKGLRERNRRRSVRHNKTGKRKSVKAPPELLLQREVPHLAFIEPERYDRVLRKINRRNSHYSRANREGVDPRQGRPRSDTRWPAQHVRCGICGRKYVLGGHGRKERMMCDGARQYRCWNAMTVNAEELARAVADEIHCQIASLPNFDEELIRGVHAEAGSLRTRMNSTLAGLQKQRAKSEAEIANLTDAIASGISSPALLERLRFTELLVTEVDDEIANVIESIPTAVTIPDADELRRRAFDAMRDLAIDDREFGRLMRTVVSDFYAMPYRLIDGGMISPRSVFQINLSAFEGVALPDSLDSMSVQCLVDLTMPNQRIMFRERVMELRAGGKTEREVAAMLGITHTAAQRAAKLDREVRRRGLVDPWQPVRTAAEAADCYARISNKRYQFEPLPGFEPKFPVAAG